MLDSSTQSLREIDVVATIRSSNAMLWATNIVECKWSREKPWVVFSSERSSMEATDCAQQAVASTLGESIIWLLADELAGPNQVLFEAPVRPGFAGKQAFSKTDVVYDVLQSVVSRTRRYVQRFDAGPSGPWGFPAVGLIAFPVIVLAGDIFDAYFDKALKDVAIVKVDKTRIHWRGTHDGTRGGPASVDIVTERVLPEYLRHRAEATHVLLGQMERARALLRQCFEDKSLAAVRHYRELGEHHTLPALIQNIAVREQTE